MNRGYHLIWRILLAAGSVCCGQYVYGSEVQYSQYQDQTGSKWEVAQKIAEWQGPQEVVSKMIVMIQGQLGEGPTLGAGIIFGLGKDQLYIATANHVVRRGTLKARGLQIKLRDLPNDFLPATLLDDADEEMDLAVVHVKGLSRYGIDACKLPVYCLGKVSDLKRGDAVYPSGYPNGVPWGMPVTPDSLAQIVGREITFQSSFIATGHSGGALLNGKYYIVGMIKKDAPPFGLAIQIEPILKVVQQWGYPVHLYRDIGGMPALHQVVKAGDLDATRRVLQYECIDVNEEYWSSTPVDYAAQDSRIEVMRLLLQAGADPNRGLIRAAESGQIEVIKLLLEAGADPNRGLIYAAKSGQLEAIKILISLGAKVDGDQDSSPLYEAMSKKKWEAAKLLLATGADITKLKPKTSLLYDVLASDELEILRLLLKHGADINAVDGEGSMYAKTLLSEAVRTNKVDTVKFLLEQGADVNIKYYGGITVLPMAIWGHEVAVVELLLEHGADINEKSSRGYTMLTHAIHENNVDVVKLLIDSKADVDAQAPLLAAAEKQGVSHTMQTNERALEILELLLKAGANVNIQRDYDKKTALQIVVMLAYYHEPTAVSAVLKLLISYGADLRMVDKNGDTPLHEAVYQLGLNHEHMFKVIKTLVHAGAPLEARNGEGKTPVDLMRKSKVPEPEIISLVESQGGKK